MRSHIITADFHESNKVKTKAASLGDRGMVLKITGVELPTVYTVRISNSKGTVSRTYLGGENGIPLPNRFFLDGQQIYVWVYLHEGDGIGYTALEVEIPLEELPENYEEVPSEEEETLIAQAIVALNNAIAETEANVALTHADVETCDADVEACAESAAQAHASEANAQTAANEAAASARQAANSASQAATRASAAATSASQAATSATAADQAKTEAAQNAAAAATSAANAGRSATAAANSATAAGNAKAAAETAQRKAETAQGAAETAAREAEEAASQLTNSDWNASEGEPGYIENRPFYEETETVTETLYDDDATFVAESQEETSAAVAQIILSGVDVDYPGETRDTGNVCTITVDGAEYVFDDSTPIDETQGAPRVGDCLFALYGPATTGVDYGMAIVAFIGRTESFTTNVKIEVLHEATVVAKTLDNKFLAPSIPKGLETIGMLRSVDSQGVVTLVSGLPTLCIYEKSGLISYGILESDGTLKTNVNGLRSGDMILAALIKPAMFGGLVYVEETSFGSYVALERYTLNFIGVIHDVYNHKIGANFCHLFYENNDALYYRTLELQVGYVNDGGPIRWDGGQIDCTLSEAKPV